MALMRGDGERDCVHDSCSATLQTGHPVTTNALVASRVSTRGCRASGPAVPAPPTVTGDVARTTANAHVAVDARSHATASESTDEVRIDRNGKPRRNVSDVLRPSDVIPREQTPREKVVRTMRAIDVSHSYV